MVHLLTTFVTRSNPILLSTVVKQ